LAEADRKSPFACEAHFAAVNGVPEPATWAEFILGFGVIGIALRRHRSQAGLPA